MSDYDPRQWGSACDRCPLNWKTPVPPKGSENAKLVIIGEAPGKYEEMRGEPFIGPSGAKLDELLKKVGLHRSQVYLTNALLCRNELEHDDGPDKFSLNAYMAWIRKENLARKKRAKATGEPYEAISSPLDCCAPRLWAELHHFERLAKERGQPNGAVCVPMGNYALQAVTGRQGIMKNRGSPIPVETEG